MGHAENAVDAAIVQYCRLRGWPTTRHHAIPYYRTQKTRDERKGWPDRIAVIPGLGAVFVECKAPGERPRQEQAKRIEEIRAADGIVVVADSAIQFADEVYKMQKRRGVV